MNNTKYLSFGLVALSAIASAQNPDGLTPVQPTTMAWRNVITGPAVAGQMDVDGRGYNFVFYTRALPTGNDGRLQKIGPAGDIVFDNQVEFIANTVTWTPNAVVINPRIYSGTVQNPYLISTVSSPGSSYLRLYKFNTAGTDLTGPFDLTATSNSTLVGAAANDTDLFVAVDGDNGGAHELVLYDYNGVSLPSDFTITGIQPTEAVYDRGTHSWFVTGIDTTDPTGLSAVWGSYDATTGVKNFGGNLLGTGNTSSGPYTRYRFHTNLLPGNQFALTVDKTDNDGAGTNTSTYYIQNTTTGGLENWRYPSSGLGTTSGVVNQVVQHDASSPIYAVGAADSGPAGFPLQFLLALQPNGTLIFNNAQQPVERLFPAADGFWDLFNWSSSNSLFLEHFYNQSTSFNWGKQYAPTAPSTDLAGRVTTFQNWIDVLKDNAGGSGTDLWIDRFVQGCTIHDISVPSTFLVGNQVPVTINLNEAVPTGQTVTVALTSFSPNVTMPDSTHSENFTFTAGQTQRVVNLNSVATGGSYSVTVMGMNSGVRRYGYTQGQAP